VFQRKLLCVTRSLAVLTAILLTVIPLLASEDRPCASTAFAAALTPEKSTFQKGEAATFRLMFTNKTRHDTWIVPHLMPFDYFVDRFDCGKWEELGGMVPSSLSRRNIPLGPTSKAEYRKLKAGDSYSATFVITPELLGKQGRGRYRVRVRVYGKEADDADLKNIGCVVLPKPEQFVVR
jgi:hypothetical protein